MTAKNESTPHPLTGGSGTPIEKENLGLDDLEQIALLPLDPDYGKLLASGPDTVQEAWPYHRSDTLKVTLDKALKAAQEARQYGDGTAPFELAGQAFRMRAAGMRGGIRWVFENEYVIIMVHGGTRDYGVTVRYLSLALWLNGWRAVQDWVRDFVEEVFTVSPSADGVKVSRYDYAFDFHAPGLTAEFSVDRLRQHLVAHSSSKVRQYGKITATAEGDSGFLTYSGVGTSARDESFTVGSIASLQTTVYDKARQITQLSGKDWMADIWAAGNDGEVPYLEKPEHMWRLEVRMSGKYLKKRSVVRDGVPMRMNTPEALREFHAQILAGALAQIRIAAFEGDTRLHRRPLHPIFSEAFRQIGSDERVPVRDLASGKRDALKDLVLSQLAGTLRAAEVLSFGAMDREDIAQLVLEMANNDPEDAGKQAALQSRYRFLEQGRS